jgi:hypothetical protein
MDATAQWVTQWAIQICCGVTEVTEMGTVDGLQDCQTMAATRRTVFWRSVVQAMVGFIFYLQDWMICQAVASPTRREHAPVMAHPCTYRY